MKLKYILQILSCFLILKLLKLKLIHYSKLDIVLTLQRVDFSFRVYLLNYFLPRHLKWPHDQLRISTVQFDSRGWPSITPVVLVCGCRYSANLCTNLQSNPTHLFYLLPLFLREYKHLFKGNKQNLLKRLLQKMNNK